MDPLRGIPRAGSASTTESVSLSRSKTSQQDHQVLADSLLRASLTSPTPAPIPTRPPLSRSMVASGLHSPSSLSLSRSRSSQAHLRTSADEMLRASLARDNAPRMSIMSSIGSSPPPYSNMPVSTVDKKYWMNKFQQDLDQERARAPRRATNGLFKEVVSVDLLFLIDCTLSMGEYIATVKEQVVNIVDDAKRAFLNQSHVRVAIVAYRDHNASPNVEFLDFTSDAIMVKKFVSSLATGWGKDFPEDVLGGIRRATNASWKQKTRCIIHIGDAPPHGRNLHDFGDDADDYPEPGSEPHSLTYEPLIKQLVALKINYVLLRIAKYTDLMTFKFGEIYKNAQAQVKLLQSNRFYKHSRGSSASGSRENGKRSLAAALQFEELELGTSFETLRHLVAASITISVTRSPSSLSKTLYQKHRVKIASKYYTTIKEEDEEEEHNSSFPEKGKPQWDTPGWLDRKLIVRGLCLDMPRHSTDTLRDMMRQDKNIKLGLIQLEIKTRSKPFAQGAMRNAFYARTSASTDRFVVKTLKTGCKSLASIAEEIHVRALCRAFALEFNALLDPKYSLDFIVTAALQPQSRADACISIEPFLDGKYVKYNSNRAYVNEELPDDPCNQAAQAFSHFTFERSRGRFLVDDLQGVGNLLTDPAVQTKDPERFKLCDGNVNEEGFKFFFSSHKCNALCRKLRLRSTKLMLIQERFEFREEWPSVRSRVYCSNKLCRRILRKSTSSSDSTCKTREFPGHYWCTSCLPQLRSSMQKRTCAEAYAVRHRFDFSSFFYESQGQAAPLKCPEHVEDTAESNMDSLDGGA
ncbi:hypothetical protein F4803DRAFT_518413 [Xylaria telfairii]|nr:hypothetical protein F4803DRAFT_518413 [Xylaria telfairii]